LYTCEKCGRVLREDVGRDPKEVWLGAHGMERVQCKGRRKRKGPSHPGNLTLYWTKTLALNTQCIWLKPDGYDDVEILQILEEMQEFGRPLWKELVSAGRTDTEVEHEHLLGFDFEPIDKS
jgi:hypothetical protein